MVHAGARSLPDVPAAREHVVAHQRDATRFRREFQFAFCFVLN